MIVCLCHDMSGRDIHGVIDPMRFVDGETIITQRKIYHALGERADRGGHAAACCDVGAERQARVPSKEADDTCCEVGAHMAMKMEKNVMAQGEGNSGAAGTQLAQHDKLGVEHGAHVNAAIRDAVE